MSFSRRHFLKSIAAGAAVAASSSFISSCSRTKERPNILWLTSEDNSPLFGCYGDEFATTPNFDKFATEGVLYENAFATAPVCAPARCTIITGVYPPSMGTQHMRSRYPVPEFIKPYPEYLREAGYYCTNNSKTDYNFLGADKSYWDDSTRKGHYKNRAEGQPFFAIFNDTVSHESSVHRSVATEELRHDPAKVPLPPYHPDTPDARHDWAQYYDRIEDLDRRFGERLQELADHGLAEDTIVIYYADHGGVLARSKRFLYDTGLHVPMIVRVPDKFKRFAPGKPGTRTDQIVTFIDHPATLLSLADIPIPEHMQGTAYLGPQKGTPRNYAQSFRGRMDERYDFSRTIRDKKFRYIRHFNPHRPLGQNLQYLWRAPLTRSWEAEYNAGRLNKVQSQFWKPKPVEELFDSVSDPWETNNLAALPEHQETLERMRQDLRDWMLDIRDSGFMPEGMLQEISQSGTVYEFAQSDKYDLERIMDIAYKATSFDAAHVAELIQAMQDDSLLVRYWGVTGCLILGDKAKAAADNVLYLLDDPNGDVEVVAAETAVNLGYKKVGLRTLVNLLSHGTSKVVLRATNALDQLGDSAKPTLPHLQTNALLNHKDDYVKRAVNRLISTLS
jgi:N-sulfoglucosamine sulfohydrolase